MKIRPVQGANKNTAGVILLRNFDKETDTIYLRARYYDPTIGRFISEDSFPGYEDDPLSLNYYTYCYNNPVNLSDPTGLDSYILYDTTAVSGDGKHTFKDEADIRAKQLSEQYGTKVWVIGVSDARGFLDKWNTQVGFDADGNHVSIDAVVLVFHGAASDSKVKSEGGIGFMEVGNTIVAASSNVDKFNSKTDIAISDLNSKSMKELYFSSCNSGNPDILSTSTAFNQRMSISNKITAWDGGTIYNYNKQQLEPGAYRGLLRERKNQKTFWKYSKKNFFGIPIRKRQGQVNVKPIIHNYNTVPLA